MTKPADDAPCFMTEDEIAFRAAINVLRDTLESGRMPSGLPLEPDAARLHEPATQRLETLLRRAKPAPSGPTL